MKSVKNIENKLEEIEHESNIDEEVELLNFKHGMNGTRLYKIWQQMKYRCKNKNSKDYERYGGRGINYCKEWESFEGFWKDMKSDYADHLTLDRKDVNGDYNKENCRWATANVQANNRRSNICIEYKGKIDTVANLARENNIDCRVLRDRIKNGWSIKKAIETPLQKHIYKYKDISGTPYQIAKRLKLDKRLLAERLRNGWAIEKAVETPKKEGGEKYA